MEAVRCRSWCAGCIWHVCMFIIRKWSTWFWGLSPKSCSPLREPVCGSNMSSKTWETGTRSMNPSLRAGGLETRESQFFSLGLKAGKNPCLSSNSEAGRQEGEDSMLFKCFLPFRPSMGWIWGPPTLGKAIYFLISWFQCKSHPKSLSQTHPEMFNQISWHSMAQSIWQIKLTITEAVLFCQ